MAAMGPTLTMAQLAQAQAQMSTWTAVYDTYEPAEPSIDEIFAEAGRKAAQNLRPPKPEKNPEGRNRAARRHADVDKLYAQQWWNTVEAKKRMRNGGV